jgi:hypothetical protein
MTKPRTLPATLRGHANTRPRNIIRKRVRKPGMSGGDTPPWLDDAPEQPPGRQVPSLPRVLWLERVDPATGKPWPDRDWWAT